MTHDNPGPPRPLTVTSIPKLVAALQSDDVDPDLLWHVGDVLTRWLTERSGGRMEGYGPEVMDIELDEEAVDALHAALLSLVEPDLTHPQAGMIVWLIGKLARPGDLPLFERALESGLAGRDDLLYQALIALDNLDELAADASSFAAFEVEKNRDLARAYLKRVATEK